MKSSDPYAATDKLDDSLLQVIVTRLEARGKHPLFEKMLRDYLDAMQIDTAQDGARHGVWHRRRRTRDRSPPRFFGTCARH